MATPDPTRTPTAVGKTLSVKVTQALYDDLAILVPTAIDQSDAVRTAIRQAADICRTAYAHGVCPPGTAPIVAAYSLRAQPGYKPPTGPYDADTDAPAQPITPPSYPAAGTTHARSREPLAP
jgi:hypothetical protein